MLQTILMLVPVIVKLWPIAREVYQMVADPGRPEKPSDALDLIIASAKEEGLEIGHTEAEMVRSAVHFVTAKKERFASFPGSSPELAPDPIRGQALERD